MNRALRVSQRRRRNRGMLLQNRRRPIPIKMTGRRWTKLDRPRLTPEAPQGKRADPQRQAGIPARRPINRIAPASKHGNHAGRADSGAHLGYLQAPPINWQYGLVDLGARFLHDFRPLLGFGLDMSGKLLRCIAYRLCALRYHFLLYCRRRERLADFLL